MKDKTDVKVAFKYLLTPWKSEVDRWEKKTGKELRLLANYVRRGSNLAYSGVCNHKRNRIRVSINPRNQYPITVDVGNPFKKPEFKVKIANTRILAAFVFFHELSHLLDRIAGLPTRNKQTKADKFAVGQMLKLRIISQMDISFENICISGERGHKSEVKRLD